MLEKNIVDTYRNALHVELDKALEKIPAYGAIEFRISFQDSRPVRIDKMETLAIRIGGQR